MIFEYFLIVITLVWLIFATVTDIKKREVPDWLNYTLVIVGLGSNLIYSIITKDFRYILYSVLGFGIFFAFANFMYFTKQWGGGDSKLLMGLGAMFGSYNFIIYGIHKLPFLVTLLINIFIAGTIYGVLYSLFLGVKNWNGFVKEVKKRKFTELKIIFFFTIILILVSFFVFDREIFYLVLLLLLMCVFGIFLLYLIKMIENVSMYKWINTNKLIEGDWLVNDIVKNGKIVCKVRNIGLTKQDIKNLKSNKVTKVLVKEGIPFVPGFLIGFLISILWGDFLLFFI